MVSMFKRILLMAAVSALTMGSTTESTTATTARGTVPAAFLSEIRTLRKSMDSDAGWKSVFSVISTNSAYHSLFDSASTVSAEDYLDFQSSVVTELLPTDVQSYFFSYVNLTSSIMNRITATPGALETSAGLSAKTTSSNTITSTGSAYTSTAAAATGGGEKMRQVGCVGVIGVVGAGIVLL